MAANEIYKDIKRMWESMAASEAPDTSEAEASVHSKGEILDLMEQAYQKSAQSRDERRAMKKTEKNYKEERRDTKNRYNVHPQPRHIRVSILVPPSMMATESEPAERRP